MPILSTINIPTPKNWEEFEDLCLSSFRLRWSSPDLVKNGRQGQPQNGVDVYGVNSLGQFVGIQCKKYDVALTEANVILEVKKAEKFKPKLSILYFATTAPSDTKIQSVIRLLSEKRVVNNKFAVGVFFWNDIVSELANNEAIFSKHFPQLSLKSSLKKGQKEIAILDLVYYGVNLSQTMELLFGFSMDDPNELSIVCNILESSSMQIMSEEKQRIFSENIKFIEDYVLPWVEGKEERVDKWLPVNKKVKKIEQEILALQYHLSNEEHTIFQLAVALANWDRTSVRNRKLNPSDEEKIKKLTRKLFGKVPKEITQQLREYKADKSVGVVFCPFNCHQICKNLIIDLKYRSSEISGVTV